MKWELDWEFNWEDVNIQDALIVLTYPVRKYKVTYSSTTLPLMPIEKIPLERLRALYDNVQSHQNLFGRNMALIFLSEIGRREIGVHLPNYNKYCEGHMLFTEGKFSQLKITPL